MTWLLHWAALLSFRVGAACSPGLWTLGPHTRAPSLRVCPLTLNPVFCKETTSGALGMGKVARRLGRRRLDAVCLLGPHPRPTQSYCLSFPGCAPHFRVGVGAGPQGLRQERTHPRSCMHLYSATLGPPPGQGSTSGNGEAIDKSPSAFREGKKGLG